MTEGDTPTSTTSDAQIVETGYKPETPKMGGIQRQSETSWTVWTGGIPNTDWSGLEDPALNMVAPTQFRPDSPSSAAKSEYYRITGLETKFTRKSDLLTFQKKVMQHFQKHGLDSITYLPDPTNKDQMISIVTQHPQFTLKDAKSSEKDNQADKYDMYDQKNIRDAVMFLYNSLDPSLETQMYENCQDNDSFIVDPRPNLTHQRSSCQLSHEHTKEKGHLCILLLSKPTIER